MGAGERMVHANGVDLCIETFGDPADPAVLLIGGASSAMDYWEDDFCARLAGGGRYVVRYDLRDTGRSVSYQAGSPQYTQPDLAADVVGLLDTLGLASTHLVGVSMGGGIAQRLAVDHPDRVASLTLIATSPAGPGGPDNPDLPPMAESLLATFTEPAPQPDWSDRSAVVAYMVAGERPFLGSLPVDEAAQRALAGRVFDRTTNVAASLTNHLLVDGGTPVRPHLGEITAPTLVLHGTEDPLFPYAHAEALAREIPNTHLIPLEKMGHQFPPPATWDIVVPAILTHTAP